MPEKKSDSGASAGSITPSTSAGAAVASSGEESPIEVELRAGNDPTWRPCSLALLPDGIRLTRAGGSFEIRDGLLTGISVVDEGIILHTVAGAPVQLRGSEILVRLASTIIGRVCTMKEVTRALRAFGSRRGKPGSEHDKFFEPLVAARRRAETERTPQARLSAFDAQAIMTSIDAAIYSFAAARFPNRDPERRALHETLREMGEPLFSELAKLDAATAAARGAPADVRLAVWREWLATLKSTYSVADSSWLAILKVLNRVKPEPPSFWRKMFQPRSRGS
jgi:hypothetical protein